LALGVIVAPSYWAPGYYSPPVYSPPTTVYAEPDPAQYWYYCTDPQGYYPYVTDCPSGWLQVVPRGPAR
jgi:hypothetical protein